MKLKRTTIFLLLVVAILSACVNEGVVYQRKEIQGDWDLFGFFPGGGRSDAMSFVIGDYCYYGLGEYEGEAINDFWRLDLTFDYNSSSGNETGWVRLNDFPGEARSKGAATASETKGYLGLGVGPSGYLDDMWCYTPETDSWEQIDNFPAGKRALPIAFTLNNDLYFGTGNDETLRNRVEMYKYDESAQSWIQTSSVSKAATGRHAAAACAHDGRAFVLGGFGNGRLNDFLIYTAENDTWRLMREVDMEGFGDADIVRSGASLFGLDGHIYVTVGNVGSLTTSTWEWTEGVDEDGDGFGDEDFWMSVSDFDGQNRENAQVIQFDNRAVVFGGSNLNDMYEFKPNEQPDSQD